MSAVKDTWWWGRREKGTIKKRIHKEREKKCMYKKILATEWNGEKIKIALKQNRRNSTITITANRQQQLTCTCIYLQYFESYPGILYTLVRASWTEFNNSPKLDETYSVYYTFCRQIYMFRLLTPIIRSWYSCKYSFCYKSYCSTVHFW